MRLDSRILSKLLAVEPDSGFFIRQMSGRPLASSEPAQTEVFSTLPARERDGRIAAANRRPARSEYESRVAAGGFRMEALNSIVLRKARRTLEQCHPKIPPRTLDAIHFATSGLRQDFPLVTTGAWRSSSAPLMGIPVFPVPENVPTS